MQSNLSCKMFQKWSTGYRVVNHVNPYGNPIRGHFSARGQIGKGSHSNGRQPEGRDPILGL